MICRSWKSSIYHLRVNPAQFPLDFEALKEKTIRIRIGAYKNR